MCDLSTQTEKPILSFEDLYYSSLSNDNIAKLYPNMSDDQVQQYNMAFNDENSFIIFDEFDKLSIKPIVRSIDLNAKEEDTKPRNAWQIGIEMSF